MSDHHLNPEAYHDPYLWAWSATERRWVRVTEALRWPDDAFNEFFEWYGDAVLSCRGAR